MKRPQRFGASRRDGFRPGETLDGVEGTETPIEEPEPSVTPDADRLLRGRIVLPRDTNAKGIQVELFRDSELSDRIGRCATDASGAFSHPIVTSPGLRVWARASLEGANARTPLLAPWEPSSDKLHELFAVREESRGRTQRATHSATLLHVDGTEPDAETYRVALIERSARTLVLHDLVVVPDTGRVSLSLDADRQLAATKHDLFLRVFLANGDPLLDATSFDVRLPLGLATKNPEIERVRSAVAIAGVSPAELTEDDIVYIARRTGLAPELARSLREAERLGKALNASTDSAYAWLRGASSSGDVNAALARARAGNLALPPTREDTSALHVAAQSVRVENALSSTGRFNGVELKALLRDKLPTTALRDRFAVELKARERAPDFWARWQANLGADQADALRFTTEVGELTDHLEVVAALEAERQRGTLQSARHLATWSPERWKSFLSARGFRAPGAFNAVADDDDEGLALYANRLALDASKNEPTLALRAALSGDPTRFPAWVRPVLPLLDGHPDYDVTQLPRLADLAILETALGKDARRGLQAIALLLRISVPVWDLSAFLSHGFVSARAIARHSLASLHEKLGEGLTGVAGLVGIHDRATAVAAKASVLHANIAGQYVRGLGALGNPSETVSRIAPQMLIEWGRLFGTEDLARCACKVCQSIYSPASYLFSLLETLDTHPIPAATGYQGVPPHGTMPVVVNKGTIPSLSGLFVERRPEVRALLLSCENTNVQVPQIDLVIELLEGMAQHDPPRLPEPIEGCSSRSTSGTSAARRAEPDSSFNPDVLQRLGAAKLPWSLPYSLERHRSLLSMDALGLWLPEVLDLVADIKIASEGKPRGAYATAHIPLVPPDQLEADDLARAKAILGVTENEWEILTIVDANPATANGYWPDGFQPTKASSRSLMSATALSFGELYRAVETRFVRNSDETTLANPAQFLPKHGCAIEQITVEGLSWDILDRLHRFVRLMQKAGLGVDELDDLFLTLGCIGLSERVTYAEAVAAVAHVVGLRRKFDRSAMAMMPLFGRLSHKRPCRDAIDDEILAGPFETHFGRAPDEVAAGITAAGSPEAQVEAAEAALASLGGTTRKELRRIADEQGPLPIVPTDDQLVSSMSDLELVAFHCSNLRRLSLLAELAEVDVIDALALVRLSALDLFPPSESPAVPPRGVARPLDVALPLRVWRFLRFAESTKPWVLPASEVAELCLPDWHGPATVASVGNSLVQLVRSLDALDATLPKLDEPGPTLLPNCSREALQAVALQVVVHDDQPKGDADAQDVAAFLDVVDAAPFRPTSATPLAAQVFSPELVAELEWQLVPAISLEPVAKRIALSVRQLWESDAQSATATKKLTASVLAFVPLPLDLSPAAVLSTDARRVAFEKAVEAYAESHLARLAEREGLGGARSSTKYEKVFTKVAHGVRLSAAKGTLGTRIASLEKAIAKIDKKALVDPASAGEAANRIVSRFLELLAEAVTIAERILLSEFETASSVARAHIFSAIRERLVRAKRESVIIQWLAEQVEVDAAKAEVLLRVILRDPKDSSRPLLDVLTDDDAQLLRSSVIYAEYRGAHVAAGTPSPVGLAIEAGLDLDWRGKPPAPGLSPAAFSAKLVANGIALEPGDRIEVRSPFFDVSLRTKATPPLQQVVSTVPSTAGWDAYLEATTATMIGELEMLLEPGGSATASAVSPKVDVRIRRGVTSGTSFEYVPVSLDAERRVSSLIGDLRRSALAMQTFGFLSPDHWRALAGASADIARRISLAILSDAERTESWLPSYLRLEALRVMSGSAGNPATFHAYVEARGGGLANPNELLASVLGLSASETREIVAVVTSAAPNADLFDELVLQSCTALASTAEEASVSSETLLFVAKSTSDSDIDAAMLSALRTQTPLSRSQQLLQDVHDPVRLRYRDALVDHLLAWQRSLPEADRAFGDRIALNQFLLTDTQVSCCVTTTRVQFGYAAVQAFVEAVLQRSIQTRAGSASFWMGALALLDREWTWKRHYRLWEANMNLFLTPENWLGDETRGDETHAFKAFRELLRQGELTSEFAEEALAGYLRQLYELSRLEIVATVTYVEEPSPIPLGFRSPELVGTHVIGRTRSVPQKYFYRRRLPAEDGRWMPWEPLNVDIESDSFDLVVHGNRLWFIWATLRPGFDAHQEHEATVKEAKASPEGHAVADAPLKHEIRVQWIERLHGKWGGRSSAPKPLKIDFRHFSWDDLAPSAPDDDSGSSPKETPDVQVLRAEETDAQQLQFFKLERLRLVLRTRAVGDRLEVVPLLYCAGSVRLNETIRLPKLYRWENTKLKVTYLTIGKPPPVGQFEAGLEAIRDGILKFSPSELTSRWTMEEFGEPTFIGYAAADASVPGALHVGCFVHKISGDIFYEVGLADSDDPNYVKSPVDFMVLSTDADPSETIALHRSLLLGPTFWGNPHDPKDADKRWAVHHYSIQAPALTALDKDEEVECRLWSRPEHVVRGQRTGGVRAWLHAGGYSIGSAGDVSNEDYYRQPKNLEYRGTAYVSNPDQVQLADGLGFAADDGGVALRLPMDQQMHEALAKMPAPYRVVMETANDLRITQEVPRFVDELRPADKETKRHGPLRTYFCEYRETGVFEKHVDVGPEVDADCAEKSIPKAIGFGVGEFRGGLPGGGVTDHGDLGILASGRSLVAAVMKSHHAMMKPGPIGKALDAAFLGRGETGRILPRGDFGSGGSVGLTPDPFGGISGGMEYDYRDYGDVGNTRACIPGTLSNRLTLTRLAGQARRASVFLPHGRAIAKDFLSTLGVLRPPVMRPVMRWVISPFHHPYAAALFGRLATGATPGLLSVMSQALMARPFYDYGPNGAVVAGAPPKPVKGTLQFTPLEPLDNIDFSDLGAFADYNWELFYHAPMLVARRLSQVGKFEDAQRWYNLVFDPAAAETRPNEAFRCMPLRYASQQSAVDILERLTDPNLSDDALLRQVHRFTNEPFRPHLIARARPIAYAKATLISYIEFLITWGDALFRTDDKTTIESAQRKYELAERLLGEVPEALPARSVAATCYQALSADGATGEYVLDPAVELESLVQPGTLVNAGMTSSGVPRTTLYFCYPGNDRFGELKTTIGDRLLKIRSCQNIEGIERELSLYGNRIDPGLIARAVKNGVSAADVFNELNAPLPRYRFKELIQRAKEVCADAKSLAQAMLGSLEKKDGESQQQLRADLDLEALRNVRQTKRRQLQDAEKSHEAAEAAKGPAEIRQKYYASRERMNAEEKSAESLARTAMEVRTAGAAAGLMAQAATGVPDFFQAVHAQLVASGTTTNTKLGGGSTAAQVFQAVQSVAGFAADLLGTQAGNAREQGSFTRRSDDWKLQADSATSELAHLDKQVAAAAIRVAIAEVEVENHEKQITHAETTRDFMRSKFTNAELYGWMSSRLSGLYYEQFRLAYETVLQAQRAWQYELGDDARVIDGSPWDPSRKGLVAADELLAKIHQLEIQFDQKKPYDHAKSPQIRLSEVAPRALLQLRNTGSCEFDIPEEYFDSIEPGGCFRRWRAIAVTVGRVQGPSAVLDGRLTLLAHSRRAKPGRAGREPTDPTDQDKDRKLRGVDNLLPPEVGGRDYIEITHGNHDFGLPEGASQEGWRLPFEGTGAISRWRLELPIETNTFDRRSLTEVVLHTVYTARNGSPEARAEARKNAKRWPPEVLIDIATLFPEEWHTFKTTGLLDIKLRPEHLPLERGGKPREWKTMTLHAEVEPGVRSLKVEMFDPGNPTVVVATEGWTRNKELGTIDSLARGRGRDDSVRLRLTTPLLLPMIVSVAVELAVESVQILS